MYRCLQLCKWKPDEIDVGTGFMVMGILIDITYCTPRYTVMLTAITNNAYVQCVLSVIETLLMDYKYNFTYQLPDWSKCIIFVHEMSSILLISKGNA